ncbi:MAG TPA: aldehyde dehydrogenase family protein [Pseudonocardia sp.]|uniref:aldehyde dehydrogenase family protein n=1 Tax=Pseudonocardia sp. TaxID=60912 RepID=UPI002F3F53FF
MSSSTTEIAQPQHVSAEELERLLGVQRAAFVGEGAVTAEVRRDRVSRLALAILENIDEIGEALSADFGHRPPALTKAFEATSWLPDVQETLAHLEEWMAPVPVAGGYVQQKPKGVVGVIGAWNFPVVLSFEPAMAALAAGNRVMLNFSEFHPRMGRLVSRIVAERFDESEFSVICGDIETAKAFAGLQLDHIFFTGSPGVGKQIAKAAATNLVPVTLELGGKNPVVVADNADLRLAAHRIAGTRALNAGQICLCPDFVYVPRQHRDTFVAYLRDEFAALFPDYLENPGVVSIVNDRNFDRITGLVDDAVAQGATRIVVAPESERGSLPDPATRRIPPTILLDVPESARIAREEIFGPVLPVYVYDEILEVINYLNAQPAPLGAYWYGEDDADFHRFLDRTTSGGVTLNDGIAHAFLPDAPFGGVGNSGSGAYHGKTGFDTFTHRRTVATVARERGVSDGLNGRALFDERFQQAVTEQVNTAAESFRAHLKS